MTRERFIESVNDFYELLEFDRDEDIYLFDDVRDADDLDGYIEEMIHEWVRYETWQVVRDRLADIPDGYEWYDTYDGIVGLTEYDFEEYKQRMIDYMDENDAWDDDDDAWIEDEGDATPPGDEPFDTAAFFHLITMPA